MSRLAALSLMLVLGACAVGPNYVAPKTPSTAAGSFAEAGRTSAFVQAPLPDHWWSLYNDPVIDRLVGDALAHNTDIREAAANLARARAVLSETDAQRLPSTNVSAGATRLRTNGSSTGIGGAGGTTGGGTTGGGTGTGTGTTTGIGQTFTTNYFRVGFDAAYEVDLFGGVTRAIQAARADTDAAQAQLDAARVSIAAETTRAYVSACSNAAQLAVVRETIKLQQKTFDLTNTLFEAGRGTRRDVNRADVLLAQSQAQLPSFEAERRAQLYALATLTGRPPAEIDAEADRCTTPPTLAVTIPVGDGEALLARRPDVRAAERMLAADTARIGVAVSDLYPKIQLLGSASLGATSIGNLGKSSSFTYSLGPLISWSFPNLSVARARVREAEADGDASLASFDGTVLTALRETEQALARYAGELDRNAALRRAEAASSKAAELSRLRFDYGADSFLLLIDAERDRSDARSALAASNAALADAQVTLFKALGGGWQDAPEPARLTQE